MRVKKISRAPGRVSRISAGASGQAHACAAAQRGEVISAGIEHPAYPVKAFWLEDAVRSSLVADLASARVH